MNIYWIVLSITAFLALLLKHNRKWFVASVSIVHIFICGFRNQYMHGDLRKYAAAYQEIIKEPWGSKSIINGGKNTLFLVLNKIVGLLSDGNFQTLLFIIAVVSTVLLSILIYYFSKQPFISYLCWNCFGFYMFSFYSLKQTLAMAILMCAVIGIYENNRRLFYVMAIIAGLIHFPAFVFLPAYEITRIKNMYIIVRIYIVSVIVIFLFRNRIVNFMSALYYEDEVYKKVGFFSVGGKVAMIAALLLAGILLCGLSDDLFRKTFILIALASLLQIFSVYSFVFTRLADYYFQFIIIYAPCILTQVYKKPYYPQFLFDKKSQEVFTMFFVCLLLLFYQYSSFSSIDSIAPQDNLIKNYKFMWEVNQDEI